MKTLFCQVNVKLSIVNKSMKNFGCIKLEVNLQDETVWLNVKANSLII